MDALVHKSYTYNQEKLSKCYRFSFIIMKVTKQWKIDVQFWKVNPIPQVNVHYRNGIILREKNVFNMLTFS